MALVALQCHAQIDLGKLQKERAQAKVDTTLLRIYNQLSTYYLGLNNDSSAYYNKKSLELAKRKKLDYLNLDGAYIYAYLDYAANKFDVAFDKITHTKTLALKNKDLAMQVKATILMGDIYSKVYQSDSAIHKYLLAIQLAKADTTAHLKIESLLSYGIYLKRVGNNNDGLENLMKAYTLIKKEVPINSDLLFTCCINLGTLHEKTKDITQALNYYREALQLNATSKDDNGLAICYYKIGKVHATQNKMDSARLYFDKTMAIHLKLKDEQGLINDYSNLAFSYAMDGNYSLADVYWQKSEQLAFKFNDSIRLTLVYMAKARSYLERDNTKEAIKILNQAATYFTRTTSKETISDLYINMSNLYQKQGDYKNALAYHKLYKIWSDSALKQTDTKRQTELKMGFEFKNAQDILKAEAREKELLNEAEREKSKQQRAYLLFGLGVISVFLFMAMRSYSIKQKANKLLQLQKKEIEFQKQMVDLKNSEMRDSINYAKHIQSACLPETNELKKLFPKGYSLIFKPKDVVSGDFYWAAENAHQVLFAVADCTGHGVPGAITSMIGNMLLNEIYYVKRITEPNLVLAELNRLVKLTLKQHADSISKDGMDIAICLWDKQKQTLRYSGANRPLYIIDKNSVLTEYKPTKLSVGGYVSQAQSYETITIHLKENDLIVLSSDGYPDQFGGIKEKKYTSKVFKKSLCQIANFTPEEQLTIIETNLKNWQGNYEQTDDILVLLVNV